MTTEVVGCAAVALGIYMGSGNLVGSVVGGAVWYLYAARVSPEARHLLVGGTLSVVAGIAWPGAVAMYLLIFFTPSVELV